MGRKPGKLFSSHLPLKTSACLSLKTVKSDVLLLPFVRRTSSSQLFNYFIVILPILFPVPFAKLLREKKYIKTSEQKSIFLHCVILNRNIVRHLQWNRLSSYLCPKSRRCVQADHFKLFLSVFLILLVELIRRM